MRYREMSIKRSPAAKNSAKTNLIATTAGGVGAKLFRRRYASVAQIRP